MKIGGSPFCRISLLSVHSYSSYPRFRKKWEKRTFFLKTIITLRVFGVRRSYLACVELIIDVFRKNKNFDENFFFHDEKSQILVNNFSRFSKFLTKKKLTKFQNFEKSQKVVDQNLRFFIVKKKVFIEIFDFSKNINNKLYAHQI